MPARDFLLVFQQKYHFTISHTTVFCPYCREEQVCKQKEYWRCISPAIKNVKLASYYKCQTCKSRFPTGVDFCGMTPSTALEHALLVAMVRCRGVNGRFQRKQARIVREAMLKIFQHEKNIQNTSLDGQGLVPSEDEIKLCANHMKNITEEAGGLEEDLMPYMVEKLTEADKKLVIRGMASVTINKKKLQPKESSMIEQVGINILGLADSTVQEVTNKEQ